MPVNFLRRCSMLRPPSGTMIRQRKCYLQDGSTQKKVCYRLHDWCICPAMEHLASSGISSCIKACMAIRPRWWCVTHVNTQLQNLTGYHVELQIPSQRLIPSLVTPLLFASSDYIPLSPDSPTTVPLFPFKATLSPRFPNPFILHSSFYNLIYSSPLL